MVFYFFIFLETQSIAFVRLCAVETQSIASVHLSNALRLVVRLHYAIALVFGRAVAKRDFGCNTTLDDFASSLRTSESISIKFGIRLERANASSISGGASV